ncbi:MAG: N-acyl homoserine lactone hydrolase [Miltoncostaeaceae bacterium]|nr:N-acyl homoserine lactone hydrolase [Miltoncostaeaceae bacterium]
MVFALRGGEMLEVRGATGHGTFTAYRDLPDAVHGMIAWPNTMLLTGPRPVVVDPGYQTQGDMLKGALATRGLAPEDIDTVLATHLHSDHVSALPQLGDVDLFVHEDELETAHARAGRGARDRARVQLLRGDSGRVLPGIRWIHTPGHTPGHVAFLVDTADGLVAIAADTLGPDPSWFREMTLPDGFPDREAHLASFARIREAAPAVVIPGHNPPERLGGAESAPLREESP